MGIIPGIILGAGCVFTLLSYYYFISDWYNKRIKDKFDKIVGFYPMAYMMILASKQFHSRRKIDVKNN